MFIITVLLLFLALFFAKKEYDANRIKWAMFWSLLVGWDFHALITSI
jgi:hypothetical protein